VLPETRRKLLLPVALYAAVSLAFLLVPQLNPCGYNAVHWLHMSNASVRIRPYYGTVFPVPTDHTGDPRVYSLPVLFSRICGEALVPYVAKLPLLAIAVMSVMPFFLPERSQRIRAVVVASALCVLSYFLSYATVWELNYVTIPPVLLVLLWLRRQEATPGLRRLLTGTFCVSLVVFLPTASFLAPDDDLRRFQSLCALQRVLPAAAAFLGLFVYGMAFCWLELRRQRPAVRQLLRGLPSLLFVGGTLAVLLGTVLAAVYSTAPSRLLKPYHEWGRFDWTAHFEDILSRPGIAPLASARMHWALARLYHAEKPRVALEHYRAVAAVGFDPASDQKELGKFLCELGELSESLKPDCAQILADLAWRLATSRADVLHNGEPAIEFAFRADQLCGGRPETLQALAAAYAEAGLFPQALDTARQAFDLAIQQDKADLAERLRSAIRLYESNQPLRQVSPDSLPR
jgi:hypothetical protein